MLKFAQAAASVIKTATFYSRYGGLHHDDNVDRIEAKDAYEMRAKPPQEPADGQGLFSPGKEEMRRRRQPNSNHAHLNMTPESADSPGGRPSINVDEMNAPSRDSANFESF